MDFFALARNRRSVRSFRPLPVAMATLERLVEAARLAPSGGNLQPLEYVAVTEPELCRQVFACLKWAAYTHPKGTPAPGHEPTAYLVLLCREDCLPAVGPAYDVGAAAQTILLGAAALGLGTCWLKAVNFPKLLPLLGVPAGLAGDSVIALGVADEVPEVVELAPGQAGREVIRYWRDERERHFVPKRALATVLHRERYGRRA